jgi:hypothetical protein
MPPNCNAGVCQNGSPDHGGAVLKPDTGPDRYHYIYAQNYTGKIMKALQAGVEPVQVSSSGSSPSPRPVGN